MCYDIGPSPCDLAFVFDAPKRRLGLVNVMYIFLPKPKLTLSTRHVPGAI